VNREFRFSKGVNSEEYANAGIAKKSCLRRTGGLLFMLIFLSGCAEFADVLIASASKHRGTSQKRTRVETSVAEIWICRQGLEPQRKKGCNRLNYDFAARDVW